MPLEVRNPFQRLGGRELDSDLGCLIGHPCCPACLPHTVPQSVPLTCGLHALDRTPCSVLADPPALPKRTQMHKQKCQPTPLRRPQNPHSFSHKLPLVSVQHEGGLRGFWFLPLCCMLLQRWPSLGKNTAYWMKPRTCPTLAGQASEKPNSFRVFLLPLKMTLSRHCSLSDFDVCLFYICTLFSNVPATVFSLQSPWDSLGSCSQHDLSL